MHRETLGKDDFENLLFAGLMLLFLGIDAAWLFVFEPPDDPALVEWCGVVMFAGAFAFTLGFLGIRLIEKGE